MHEPDAAQLPHFLAFRPALHSIEQIVHALVPYYGPNHPVAAIAIDAVYPQARIEGTLSSIAAMVSEHHIGSRLVFLIR